MPPRVPRQPRACRRHWQGGKAAGAPFTRMGAEAGLQVEAYRW